MKIRRRVHRASERGQTLIPIFVFISLFLLAMLGVAADYTQLWAHRQMAQGAADAACEAAAADLYINAINPSASGVNGLVPFTYIGTTFNCSTNTGTPVCRYAALNGYSGSNVNVTFPSSLPGVAPLPPSLATAHPYVEVTITDPVPMSFTRMVSGNPMVSVKAKAGCGVAPANVPVPLVILHPTAASSFSVGGSARVTIFGGPQRSVQVDSSNVGAVSVGTVNLSQGGPSNTGSDFAVLGGPTTQPLGITLGSTGHYISPATPFGDPFATIAAPSRPAVAGSVKAVPLQVNGCPDPNGCIEFSPGDFTGCLNGGNINPGDNGCLMIPYTGTNPKFNVAAPAWIAGHAYSPGTIIQPTNAQNNGPGYLFVATNSGTSAANPPANWAVTTPCTPQPDGTCSGGTLGDGTVTWRNIGKVVLNKLNTAIFDPGLYYVGTGGLNIGNNATVRISTAAGDGSNGVMFYFSTSASVAVTSNAGKAPACTQATSLNAASPNACVVSYKTDGTVSSQANSYVPSRQMQCPSGPANPPEVPSSVDGDILMAPCSGTYASPDGNRGFLFFQNRSTPANPSWGGGGQFLSSGFLYFHSGGGATCGTNTSCLTLQGGSGAQSYTLGNIVVDELALGGNPQINMILNPSATFEVLRPTLLE